MMAKWLSNKYLTPANIALQEERMDSLNALDLTRQQDSQLKTPAVFPVNSNMTPHSNELPLPAHVIRPFASSALTTSLKTSTPLHKLSQPTLNQQHIWQPYQHIKSNLSTTNQNATITSGQASGWRYYTKEGQTIANNQTATITSGQATEWHVIHNYAEQTKVTLH